MYDSNGSLIVSGVASGFTILMSRIPSLAAYSNPAGWSVTIGSCLLGIDSNRINNAQADIHSNYNEMGNSAGVFVVMDNSYGAYSLEYFDAKTGNSLGNVNYMTLTRW